MDLFFLFTAPRCTLLHWCGIYPWKIMRFLWMLAGENPEERKTAPLLEELMHF